ncbi:O-antigen translocase [Carboxylicivirga litoralis]|uniref:O-antigen translocase n=1 Tax=Carboxylicivirga litoralis TaxID=2816963 RepID=UPI0021CB47EC|nr:O-antigen translocase [Carboxylicivirga sp. A043]
MKLSFTNNRLLTTSIKNSSQVLVRVIIGILNIKIIALLTGPTGLAIVSQLQNALQFGTNLANTGINHGIIKCLSEYQESPSKRQLVIITSILIVIIASVFIGLCFALLSGYISEVLFQSNDYILVVRFAGIYIITTSLFNLLISIINGIQKLKLFITLNILYFISSFILTISALYFLGLKGLLWAILFQSLLALSVGAHILYKHGYRFKPLFSTVVMQKLTKFSLTAITSGIVTPLVVMSIRTILTHNLALHEAGIWEGINRISTSYISFATLPFGYYFLPTFAKLKSNKEIKREIKIALLTLTPILIAGGLLLYILRIPVINVILSKEFHEAAYIIKWQIMGDVLKVLCWLLGFLLIAKEKTVAFIVSEAISGVLVVSLCYFLVPIIGIEGSTLAYFIENIISFSLLYIVFQHYWRKD